MAFTEHELQQIDELLRPLCERVPVHLRDKLRNEYVISAQQTVTLEEVRPNFRDTDHEVRHGIARFRYVRAQDEWQLFWQRANRKWERYDPFPASPDLAVLVAVVAQDPHSCFFG